MFSYTINKNFNFYSNFRKYLIKIFFFFSVAVLSFDTIYKSYYGITYQTRQNCILYSSLPRWMFLIYEYIVELFLVVIMGVLIASYIEKHFMKFKKFLPQNNLSAFLYASVLPVCSCSVIPMIKSLINNSKMSVIFTFIVAAPLLNPYIIMLSVSTLGIDYLILRIIASLILALSSGYILEYFYNRFKEKNFNFDRGCIIKEGCSLMRTDIFEDAYQMLKRLFPYILIAGLLSIGVELLWHSESIQNINIENSVLKSIFIIILGLPVYLCNGADVLFIKPFLNIGTITSGMAIAFSLTSTSICVTSIVVLVKYIGKKLTVILGIWILFAAFFISQIIDLII